MNLPTIIRIFFFYFPFSRSVFVFVRLNVIIIFNFFNKDPKRIRNASFILVNFIEFYYQFFHLIISGKNQMTPYKKRFDGESRDTFIKGVIRRKIFSSRGVKVSLW